MMEKIFLKNIGIIGLIIILFCGYGCFPATKPVMYYTLTPLSRDNSITNIPDDIPNLSIGVGPLMLPEILNRTQIVTRIGENRFEISDFHRWGGPLDDNFQQVLIEDLSILLHTYHIQPFPGQNTFKPEYRICLKVHQFDGRLGEKLLLNVTWTINHYENRKRLLTRNSILEEIIGGTEYEDLVAAKSRVIANLSREIAKAIAQIHHE